MSALIDIFAKTVLANPQGICLIDSGVGIVSRQTTLDWITELGNKLEKFCPQEGKEHDIVALLLPRSWAVPTAMLATRHAEMAYMPLDIGQPRERYLDIIARVEPRFVISFTDFDEVFWKFPYFQILDLKAPLGLEDIRIWMRVGHAETVSTEVSHIIFTSGSTGQPKGVLLQENALLDTIKAQQILLHQDIQPGETAIWPLNPGFDASLSDIFCTLLSDIPLAIFRPDQKKWKTMAEFVKRHNVKILEFAPSLMRIVSPGHFPVKSLIFGGERCDANTVKRWSKDIVAYQAYGPTETAICAMVAQCGQDWQHGLLGRPLENKRIILATKDALFTIEADPNGDFNKTICISGESETPNSVSGEIWIVGESVAYGYWKNPQATKARFGKVKLNGKLETVHYTGDIAKWENGYLIWLGRNDRQVKINGRLICPEEIESFIERTFKVPCVCLLKDKKFILFIKSCQYDEQLIKKAISDKLGAVFSPQAVEFLSVWPLNSNKKTDISAIKAMLHD